MNNSTSPSIPDKKYLNSKSNSPPNKQLSNNRHLDQFNINTAHHSSSDTPVIFEEGIGSNSRPATPTSFEHFENITSFERQNLIPLIPSMTKEATTLNSDIEKVLLYVGLLLLF